MDITTLPFDADAMLEGLRPWVECESPTFERTRVNAMMDIAARECALSGATIERIAGRMGFGDCVRAKFSFGHAEQPGTRASSRSSSSMAGSTDKPGFAGRAGMNENAPEGSM